MIERKPSPAPRRSLKSLEAGLALYPHFRRHISLSGPVTAAQVQAISEATGLKIGSVTLPSELVSGLGFVDPTPPANLQSVAASCLSLRGSPHALGFSGFIDVNANVATLDLFESSEVTWPNKYTATTVSQERFSVSVSRTTYPKP